MKERDPSPRKPPSHLSDSVSLKKKIKLGFRRSNSEAGVEPAAEAVLLYRLRHSTMKIKKIL